MLDGLGLISFDCASVYALFPSLPGLTRSKGSVHLPQFFVVLILICKDLSLQISVNLWTNLWTGSDQAIFAYGWSICSHLSSLWLRLAPGSLILVNRSTDTQLHSDCNLKRRSGARKGWSQRIEAWAASSSKWVQSKIIDRYGENQGSIKYFFQKFQMAQIFLLKASQSMI